MELQLKNIGMIKEANVKIDGLTVVAGENDTGKSTVGKALFIFLNYWNSLFRGLVAVNGDASDKIKVNQFHKINGNKYQNLPNMVFKSNISNTKFSMKYLGNTCEFYINKDNYIAVNNNDENNIKWKSDVEPPSLIIIETPLVWNLTDFFRDIAQVESQLGIELEYPYLMKDLNFKLHIKSVSDGFDIKKQVTDLMGGEFKKDEMGKYYFDKQGQRIELVNTATGIKTFGIFQVLSQNNYLNKDTVLVLDEPEVHLHPKWQLEMAKVIVELVKNGVKVLVNSHSPYMIEALKRYSEEEEIEDKTNFYLAEGGYIKQIEDSNSKTLVEIYEKLSQPYDTFEEMESQRMEKMING